MQERLLDESAGPTTRSRGVPQTRTADLADGEGEEIEAPGVRVALQEETVRRDAAETASRVSSFDTQSHRPALS